MSGAPMKTPARGAAEPAHTTVQLLGPPSGHVDQRTSTRREAGPGDVIADRYELRERLAAGGLGVVYRATHRETGRVVAVKLLHHRYRDEPSLIERAAREARFACAVEHPSIVEILDAGRSEDGQAYIAMEFLHGQTLRTVLKDAGSVDPLHAAGILLPIVEAIAAAHAVGVVHRDLKPENVMILEAGGVRSVKVLDFGIAGSVSEPGVEDRLTTIGTVLGTHAYMSPEQATGGPPEPPFDVFSLGVMLYELLTGVLPFGSNPSRSLTAKIRGVVDAAPYERTNVPEPWRALITRCLAINPSARPTAAELRDELSALVKTPRRSITWGLGRALRRAGIGLAIVGLLALLGAGTWLALSNAPVPVVTATAESSSTDPVTVEPIAAATVPTVAPPSAAIAATPATPEPDDARASARASNPKRSPPVRSTTKDEASCTEVRAAMHSAREAHRWSDMLAAAGVRRCWTADDRRQWRTKALMELGRFAACATEGRDATSEQVRGWARLCERRLARELGQ